MAKYFHITSCILMICLQATAQTLITGRISTSDKLPLPGVNVYCQGAYDGAASDENGNFQFSTPLQGKVVIVASLIGYRTFFDTLLLYNDTLWLQIVLKEEIRRMEEVVITTGSFQASDEARGAVLTPLEIVTTPGALGDINRALRMLPGTQQPGEDGRLIVRGGDPSETSTFIDGLLSQTSYGPAMPDLPVRGRFSPFLFKGTTFSTGGYSAEYGQALSSVLLLETTDFPDQTETELSLMSVGAEVAHHHRWEKTSLSAQGSYTNLSPYRILVPSNRDWDKFPEIIQLQMAGRYETPKKGLLKAYANATHNTLSINQQDADHPDGAYPLDLENRNYYSNLSFMQPIGNQHLMRGGLSATYDHAIYATDAATRNDRQQGLHAKLVREYFTNDFTLITGIEYQVNHFFRNESDEDRRERSVELEDHSGAMFSEIQWRATPKINLRGGLRGHYWHSARQYSLSPRVAAGYQVSQKDNFSLAVGRFLQPAPQPDRIQSTRLPQQEAWHFIAGYNRNSQNKLLRVEVFHKEYAKLLTYSDGNIPGINGEGHASGIDFFWREDDLIEGLDYWVSYSYTHSQRKYLDYPVKAPVPFAAPHTLSLVGRYFVDALRTQFGLGYQFLSGRPYHNPNQDAFMEGKTPSLHTLDWNAAYLISSNVILFGSITNLTGTDLLYGYQFSSQPDADGNYTGRPIRAEAPRFFFLGLFITFEKRDQREMLERF